MLIQINGFTVPCKLGRERGGGWRDFYVMDCGKRVARHTVPSAALSVGGAFLTGGNLYKVLEL